MSDLRALAVILDEGHKAADRIEDAGLSATLAAMTEAAIGYAEEAAANRYGQGGPGGLWNLVADYEALRVRVGYPPVEPPQRPL